MKSFNELYNEFDNNTQIKKIQEEIEIENKQRNKKILRTCLIADLIVIVFFSLSLKFSIITLITCIIPIVIIDIIILVLFNIGGSSKQDEFRNIFKQQIIKNMIENFFSDMEYFPDLKLPQRFYDEGNYKEKYDEYDSDDNIRARLLNNYLVNIGEVETKTKEEYTDSNGYPSVRYTTIFHGLFARICLEKNIATDLRITSKKAGYKNKIEMDYSEFENLFDVFTSDQIKGMQILTADIMNEILEFKNKTTYDFDIYINDNRIYLRFHCGSLFEPNSLKTAILDEKSLALYYDILEFIYDLSNILIKTVNDVEI